MTSSMPYASATSGTRAREETIKWLRRLGCEQIGFVDDFENQELILAFVHRGQRVQLRASARGWASKWLKENPQGSRSRVSSDEYRRAALEQGQRAVNSFLRDEVKGYVTRIESGVRSFEEVFWSYMLTSDGRPLHERVKELQLLPQSEPQKVIPLMREQKP